MILFQFEIAWNLNNCQWIPFKPCVCEDIKRSETEIAHNGFAVCTLHTINSVFGVEYLSGGRLQMHMDAVIMVR